MPKKNKLYLIFLSISVILFLYIFYRSEIFYSGKNREYYYIYYLISLVSFFFFTACFYLRVKFNKYLFISALSSIFTLYLFESYLLITDKSDFQFVTKDKIDIYQAKTGKKFDERKKIEIYKDLKKKDNSISLITPSINLKYKNIKILPLGGVSNVKTIFCNENGYYSIYLADRYGFNNPDEQWDKSVIEFFLAGDSFVHGACVNRPFDLASNLRKINNSAVLNLGYAGNGPLKQLASIKEYLNPKVKKIIWFYYSGNDFKDLREERLSNILKNYLKINDYSQNLKMKQNEINNFIKSEINKAKTAKFEKEKIKFQSKFFSFIKLYKTRYHLKPMPKKLYFRILQEVKQIAKENNSDLFLVYLPQYNEINSKTSKNYKTIKNFSNKLDIKFIDIKVAFENEDNSFKFFPFEKFGHYNEKGYKKIAEIISKY